MEARTGLHFSTIGKYERGERRPNLDVLRELAAVYEVSVADLIGDGPGADRPDVAELADMGRHLSPAQVQSLIAFLRLVSTPHPPSAQEPPHP